MESLRRSLREIDGQSYIKFKKISGSYLFPDYRLLVDHVQGDPFADPSRLRAVVPMRGEEGGAGFDPALFSTPIRKKALEDFLGQAFAAGVARWVKGRRGLGKSGDVRISVNGQQILKRNAVVVNEEKVEVRFQVGLPADGRRILGRQAEAVLFDELPKVVASSLYAAAFSPGAVQAHVEACEDQDFLRNWLAEAGLAAFVADGSLLPRASGVDDRPLEAGEVVPFTSPESLAREVELPHRGRVRGMGIPTGVTLIVGGGFHGKSTLLNALEMGVYDHRPGDGRELTATDSSAMKIRAEDGRAVTDVDIRPFIGDLPFGRETRRFTTENASGSTSQAANIIEALACGSRLLLIDEDTSATNFMIRDARMQKLVSGDREPITPLAARARDLYARAGASSIIVMGGSSGFFGQADTVILMDNYAAAEVTAEARALAADASPLAAAPLEGPFVSASPRRLDLARFRGGRGGERGGKPLKIKVPRPGVLLYGREEIDMMRVEQLVDPGQTRAVGFLIKRFVERSAGGDGGDAVAALREVLAEAETEGLDILTPWIQGHLAMPRLLELAAAVNRFRGLRTPHDRSQGNGSATP